MNLMGLMPAFLIVDSPRWGNKIQLFGFIKHFEPGPGKLSPDFSVRKGERILQYHLQNFGK